MIKPLTLTQDELDKLKQPTFGIFSNWDRNWSNDYGYNDWATPSSSKRTRHEWVKDIYFTSKVFWTCKHCGAKQEDPNSGDYCEKQEDIDTGGW